MRVNLLIISLLSVLFMHCDTDETATRNIKDFYYPVEDLKDGMVYEFESTNDTFPTFYWYFQTVEDTSGTYLVSSYYDYNFMPYQFAREQVVHNGIQLVDSYLYEPDTLQPEKQQQIPVEILAGNVFPFEVQAENNGVLLYKVQYQEYRDPLTTITLVKNRQYKNETMYNYQGKTYDAAEFYVRELIDNYNDGHLEHEFDGLEIYARGIGLVYFKKNVSPGLMLEYELKDRYSMQELEEKYKVNLQ